MGASIPTLHEERAKTEFLMCRLSLFVTDMKIKPAASQEKSHIQETIDINKLIFKYKILGSNFSFKPHEAPLNTHYAFAKDFKSMTRLVDVYLKDIRT
jgi:hypothetical protein